MNLCQKPKRIKLIERDESLLMKTHKRTEKIGGPDFYLSCVIFMRLWVAQRPTVLTNKNNFFAVKMHKHTKKTCIPDFFNMLFCWIKSYLWNEIKVFKKAERLEWKRTGALKKHAILNFLSSLIFMRVCTAQKRII